ncbi:MAG: PQQ-binding-like beta-propeller repeat protein [Planctomycetota bacterium]|nr:PQQ-binding-like beta-propeller repeat protein [Planctomycetota bacterium]
MTTARRTCELFAWSLLAGLLLAGPGRVRAESAEAPAAALLEKTGLNGGLCLVLGAKDTALATALAAKSALYVQVLQPDAARARAWGQEFAHAPLREKLGLRDAAFNAGDYGSDLFNLVVVEDPAALGAAKLADLCRILTPEGTLALRAAPPAFAEEAKSLGMTAAQAPGFASAWRKPVPPVAWKPADSLKWRAGMRAHMSCGIFGPTFGNGRFYYREQVEAEGGWPEDTTQLVARDAYNGRVLWIKQEASPRGVWRTSAWTGWNWSLGADNRNRLFSLTKDGRLVCLDGATGEERFELIGAKAGPGYVTTHLDTYVVYGNSVFSAADGKLLWKWNGKFMALEGETLFESDGAALRARKLADGSELFKADLSWRGDRVKKSMGLQHLGSHLLVTEGGRWERPFVVSALNPSTGEKLWSVQLGGIFALPPQGPKDAKLFTGGLQYARMGDKLLAYCITPYFYDKDPAQMESHFTLIDLATGKVEKEDYGAKGKTFGNACGTEAAQALGDYLYFHHNVWLNYKTMERVFPYLVHPACSLAPQPAYGMIFNSPGRKGGSIQGITATGPADLAFDQAPGGKIAKRYAAAPAGAATAPGDWPTFRGNNARGNAAPADLGAHLTKLWEVQVGLGHGTYGRMNAERTGLTQATLAYGMAYVADIDAQRVVALDAKDGKEKWACHLGSRADFPPTLYKGLCLVATKDGYVHALDATTGAPVYKLLVAPRERLIGGQEKLESLWPTAADVMVGKDGLARASAGFSSTIHGGNREVFFKPESGEVADSKVNYEPWNEAGYPGPKHNTDLYTEPLAGGFQLKSRAIDDMLGYGNSISRTNEDRAGEVFSDGRNAGRAIAFDEGLCVAFQTPRGESWALAGPMVLTAAAKDPKNPAWKSEPIELIADDLVLSPNFVYVAGHYRRVKGESELWVLARADGKVLSKTPVGGFPSYLGLSAANGKLFVATRDGKLICFGAK